MSCPRAHAARRRATIALLLTGAALAPAPAAAQTPADHAIRREQRAARRNPADAAAHHRLGDAYIQKARVTGDLAYLALAEQALRRSLELAPDRAGSVRHLAHVLAMRHEFQAAAEMARRAIEMDPADPDAHGVLGDASLELGRYDAAARAYERMAELGPSLASYGRTSGLRSLRGDPRGAIEDLRRAVAAGRSSGQPPESVAWAQWQLGAEHFAIGELEAAEAQHRAALGTQPGYHRALAGLAQVRAAQGRDAEAAALYGRAIAAVPLPEYAAALGDLYTRMGRTAEARKQYDLVAYVARLGPVNRTVHDRELAYFRADHDIDVDAALALARDEIAVRRDVYGWDVLAWALYKSGRPREALGPMAEALRLGTRDARLFFHAGMIHHALGDRERAQEWLQRALDVNPRFHVLHASMAERTLADLTAAAAAQEAKR